MASQPVHKLTEQEYLALERAAETKSEFFQGEMFAMSGASKEHSRISGNILGSMWGQLRGRDCEVMGPDMRLRVNESGLYTYPDAQVVCGGGKYADDAVDTLLNPTVVFEILSKSTAGYDRGSRFQSYRAISSLREYILVDSLSLFIEQYVQQANNTWLLRDLTRPDQELRLESIGVTIPVSTIYERVSFD